MLVAGRALPDAFQSVEQVPSQDGLLPNISHSTIGVRTAETVFALPPPASDDLWAKCVCKGSMLTAGMSGTDKAAGQLMVPPQDSVQSKFVSFPQEFQRWFYHLIDIENMGGEFGDFDDPWGVGKALRALGVNDKKKSDQGKNELVSAQHWDPKMEDEDGERVPMADQTYIVDGRELPVTGAIFNYAINPDEGVIMALRRENPKHSVQRNELKHVEDDELPELGKSSDITFGLWSMLAQGPKLQKIRYFFSLAITNDDTLKIIARAATNGELKEFPGETFPITDERGKALLGAPNGLGIGYMLMQHKNQLGNLYVSAVNVFQCSRPDKIPCLLYQIGSLSNS